LNCGAVISGIKETFVQISASPPPPIARIVALAG
jgi:hypothetical protein